MRIPTGPAVLLSAAGLALLLATCVADGRGAPASDVAPPARFPDRHLEVMESAFCKSCHPDIYAEHEQSTHGRAYTDEEVRLATARFAHTDCIICHTPRPIFETGTGMNPIRRHHDLVEGNTCMTCHWKPEFDYSGFRGGEECRTAFHPDVGTVEACASCHRNHGTPYQWEKSPTGRESGRVCMDCHMAEFERPIAVGGPVRRVRSHVFPGSRNEAHVARAYAYEARVEGSAVVVTVRNKGAGHNFPTELKQRSVESVIVVKDLEGDEVARSRMVFRDPYKRPYGLELPVNTQIPGGQAREHRVPIPVAAGTIETHLFFKLYFPIDDWHPELSRVLETRTLPFEGVEPSSEPVVSDPDVRARAPEGISPESASPANLVDFARPPIGTVAVDIPAGDGPDDVRRLIELFQFPVPEANGKARARLAGIGAPAVPALVEALGSWDNKTWNQAMQVLAAIGEAAREGVVAAMRDERLYVRLHTREVAWRAGWKGADVEAALREGLSLRAPLDRASAAEAVGELELAGHEDALRRLLGDADPDVVRASALALARVGDREAVPAIREAMHGARYVETRRDLAGALARLGSADGIPLLLDGLDHPDDLIRESCFEEFHAATGMHLGYEPLAPRPERLAVLAALHGAWARGGGPGRLQAPRPVDRLSEARAARLVSHLGGNDLVSSTPEKDRADEEELVAIGEPALEPLFDGLKWPSGFADKRAALCRILGRIGDPRAGPALSAALRDPVIGVTSWAAWALERVRDPETVGALRRYEQRLMTLAVAQRIPEEAGTADGLLAQSARTRLLLGDDGARPVLAGLLLSEDAYARALAFGALEQRYGEDRGYDPEGPLEERRAAAARWAR